LTQEFISFSQQIIWFQVGMLWDAKLELFSFKSIPDLLGNPVT